MIIEALLVAFVVLIGLLFVGGGVALAWGVGSHLWRSWAAFFAALESREWATTIGKVTRSVVTYSSSGRRGRLYAPAIRYAYAVGGETFVSERFAFVAEDSEAAARAVVERFRAGSEVEVHYDPSKPKRATLDRSVPSVVGPTLGWALTLLFGGGVMLFLGVNIVTGPFEDPPNLGEVPSLRAQLGGLAAGLGALSLLVGGARSIRREERRKRRLLGHLEAASPALVRELSPGKPVTLSGRAENLETEPDDDVDEGVNGTGDEPPNPLELPFEDKPLVYYDLDVEWFRRTCFATFAVRDASGVVLVELSEPESTLLESRRHRIAGEVERWLDAQREDPAEPIASHPEWLRLERIREGDPVLVFGSVEREEDGFAFRAREGDPTSLLVADGSREEILERLRKPLRKTRALALVGAGLLVVGAAAMVV